MLTIEVEYIAMTEAMKVVNVLTDHNPSNMIIKVLSGSNFFTAWING